ncbi:MAG: SemiSWEET transporter [Candidatus Omnitrophica bacterium]|nr:SemiSWEET transporter [Candidatus Omnitrophota bacterium]MDD5591978.1 SemiSWEET transporter [Candidatus Omnitrophota bacterium]
MFWTIIGLSAATLTMFSFLPQIIKVWQHKSAKDVSLVTLLQLSLGVLLWIVYGIYLRNKIIIIANGITLSSLVILLYLYYKYRRKRA